MISVIAMVILMVHVTSVHSDLCGWEVKAALDHSTCRLNVWVAHKTAQSLINIRDELYRKSYIIYQLYFTLL